ncbi:site-specific integrase [Natronomonas sp. F2-12]|uniref:Site-specific integrase n=1 Tax=Natronomonas aquatica TaxID=2841590 RepID=A0A9R1D4H4_9EURY|nr:site-specific integrase [Natronomonas aquatica]MCQ4331946.1 site-specific integrase [Natronomonas aquatica]
MVETFTTGKRGSEEIEVPDEIAHVLHDLETKLEYNSYRKTKTGILHYLKFCQEKQGTFPTDGNSEMHARMVNSYFEAIRNEGYARETISGRWTWVSRLYQQLSSGLLNGYAFLEEDPFELLEERENKTKQNYLPKESRESKDKRQYYVSKDDLETLCDNITSPAFRNETLLRLMWTTGLRCSEIVHLKVDEINLEENRLEKIYVSKTDEKVSLWIPETTAWYLDQYINGGYRDAFSYAEESDYLFLTNRAEKMHRQTPNKVIKRTAEKAGMQEVIGQTQDEGNRYKITAHAFRRGHGMHLWKDGQTITTISDRLNHSSAKQTREYLPISVEDSQEKLESVSF